MPKRSRLLKNFSEREKAMLRLAKRFPPLGEDKKLYDSVSDEEKLKLLKKWGSFTVKRER